MRWHVVLTAIFVGNLVAMGWRPHPTATAGESRPALVAQTGHTLGVTSATFSADGRQAFTGSADHRVIAWDVVTGRQLRTYRGLKVRPTSLAFHSGRGLMMAAGNSFDEKGSFGQAMFWNARTGQVVDSGPRIDAEIECAALSPDGRWLLAGGKEHGTGGKPGGCLLLWDITTGKGVATLDAGTVEVHAVAFHPESRLAISGARNGDVVIWDVVAHRPLRRLAGHSPPSPVSSVTFSPDGRLALTGSWDQTAVLWDVATGSRLRTFAGHSSGSRDVKHVVFSSDGRWVITGATRLVSNGKTKKTETTGELIVWDAANGLLQGVLRGHHGEINSVAMSTDSQHIASSSKDGTAIVWSRTEGEERHTLQHDWEVRGAAFSPDGTRLATAGKQATIWDVASGKKLRTLDKSCRVVAYRPDGKQLATDEVVWDTATSEKVVEMEGVEEVLTAAAFSPDGRQVVTGHWGGEVVLWDAGTGQRVRRLEGHTDRVSSANFGPQGRTLLTFVDGFSEQKAVLWDTTTGKRLREFTSARSDDKPRSAALSPDGRYVLTGAEGKAILCDASNGRGLRSFRGHTEKITCVAFSPGGRDVLTAGGGDGYDAWTRRQRPFGELVLWDVKTGRQLNHFAGLDSELHCAAFSPDGRYVLAGCENASAVLLDRASGQKLRVLGRVAADEPRVAFSADGRRVRILIRDTVTEWDLVNWPATRKYAHGGLLFSPDGRQLLMDSPAHTAALADADTGKLLRTLDHPALSQKPPFSLRFNTAVFSPDGRRLFTSTWGPFTVEFGTYLWDTRNGQRLRTFEGQRDKEGKRDFGSISLITSAAFSPDGLRLVTGSMGKEAIVWDVQSAQQLRTLRGHLYWVTCVAFSPDGKQVVTGGGDCCAILWDAASGQQVHTLEGHTDWVNAVAFSPDGQQVATASGDGTVILWDAARGKHLRTLTGHQAPIFGLVFRPDGRRLLTGSRDGTARLWDVTTGQELCSIIVLPDGTVVATPDGYYTAPKAALTGLAFRVGDRALPFDQFDLRFNRPDLVLERLGEAPQGLITAYRRAYAARLRRLNFTEDMLGDDFHAPVIAVTSNVPLSTEEKSIKLQIRASDSKHLLDRVHVSVNGVPVYGVKGIDVRDRKTGTWQQEVAVELCSGKNVVRVSALNARGAESLKETVEVTCTKAPPVPELYLVAIGISDYEDAHYRLSYADKDAADLADLWVSKKGCFGNVHVVRLLNREATKSNILKVRELLMKSRVDDQVVVFFAGHGLLDSKRDYYFATVDTDFREPAVKGLSYEAIEGLLDGLPARRKLLLIDTCHSGDMDKGISLVEKLPEGEIRARGVRGLVIEPAADAELSSSVQVLQEVFADLRRGTGTVAIAAAGGAEFALETAAWKHGVFTYALLQGLGGSKADGNGDGRISASELRTYVTGEVRRLTRGRQTPAVRQDNLEFDFPVF